MKIANIRWLVVLLVFLFPCPVWSAPTFDALAIGTATGVSTHSFNLTIGGACANNIVIVGAGNANGNFDAGITSVTIDGVAATNITGQAYNNGSFEDRVELWYRVGVTTGVRAIVTNYADAGNVVTTSARSYCNVNQATPIGTGVAATGSDATPTVNVPSASGELVVDAAIADAFIATTLTVTAPQTQRTNDPTWVGGGYYFFGESEKAGAGTVTMSWTLDHAQSWAIVGVSLKPSGAAAAVQIQTIVVE